MGESAAGGMALGDDAAVASGARIVCHGLPLGSGTVSSVFRWEIVFSSR